MAVINQCQGNREIKAPFSETFLSELLVQNLLNLLLHCSLMRSEPSFKEETQGCTISMWISSGFCAVLSQHTRDRSSWATAGKSFVLLSHMPYPALAPSVTCSSLLFVKLCLWLEFLLVPCYLWLWVDVFIVNTVCMSWWLAFVWNLVREGWRCNCVSHCLGRELIRDWPVERNCLAWEGGNGGKGL